MSISVREIQSRPTQSNSIEAKPIKIEDEADPVGNWIDSELWVDSELWID